MWTDMQELEKIIQEMQKIKEIMLSPANVDCFGEPCKGNDCIACVVNKCMEIVKNHMNDGWILVEKFGLPKINEHDFRFWVTIQYVNGFRHTIKAKWDCFDKCFMHPNGKKILQDVIAYKYYSAPEPYRPERSEGK